MPIGTGLIVLTLCAAVAWASPEALPLLVLGAGAALLLVLVVPFLVSRVSASTPLLLALAGFVVITVNEDGFQLTEVVYGLTYGLFLILWFARAVMHGGLGALLHRREDTLALLILAWGLATTLLGVFLFDARVSNAFGELTMLALMGFYFPVRDYCRHHPEAARRILQLLVFYGLYVTARNVLDYRTKLASAEMVWQLAMGRVASAELLMVSGVLASLVLAFYQRAHLLLRVGYVISAAVCLGGVLLTQSRGYWVTLALSLVVLFVTMDGTHRVRLALTGVGSALLVTLAAYVALGKTIFVIGVGLLSRLLTVGTATTRDISLVSRIYEAQAVLERVAENPLLGHGMAAEFSHFNIIGDITQQGTFIHNGVIAMLFKFGIVGLLLIAAYWLLLIGRAWTEERRAARLGNSEQRALLAFGVSLLAGWLFVMNTSSPFSMSEGYLFLGLVGGAISGSAARLSPSPAVHAA